MAGSADEIRKLINEVTEIDDLAASIQVVKPAKNAKVDMTIRPVLQERYLSWYGRCLSFLLDELKPAFKLMYHDGNNPSIYHFLLYGDVIVREEREEWNEYRGEPIATIDYVWMNLYQWYFKNPISQQRLILLEAEGRIRAGEPVIPPPSPDSIDAFLAGIHPSVAGVLSDLFRDGHYNNCILKACDALDHAVKAKSGLNDHGASLMQSAFSERTPLLKLNSHPEEQKGNMFLYTGLVFAIRNPVTHTISQRPEPSVEEAMEILSYVSWLFRQLDRATV